MKTQRDLELLFIFPSLLNGRLFEGFDYHLGAGYIRAFLLARGIRTAQYVSGGNLTLAQHAQRILNYGPRMLGFSCYDNNYLINKFLASAVRRLDAKIPIVFGGPSATFSSEILLEDCAAIDICGRSYCEETAYELVQWSRGRTSLSEILGITYRDRGRIVTNAARSLPDGTSRNVDDDGERSAYAGNFALANNNYVEPLDLFPDPFTCGLIPPERVADIGIVTSRGCAFACTFCVFSALSQRTLHCHSDEYVLRLLRFLNARHTQTSDAQRQLVTINDDNFSMNPRRLEKLLAAMCREDLTGLMYWAEMRVDVLREETFQLLAAANFREINFGLESAVPRVLAAMHKVRVRGAESDGYAREQGYVNKISWAIGEAGRRGIETTVSIILGGPGETLDDGRATLEFVERTGVGSYAHNYLGVSAGTALADSYREWGIEVSSRTFKRLPLVTKVTYDVYQIRILPNDRAWLPMTGFEMRQVASLFSGLPHFGEQATRPRNFGRGGSGRSSLDRHPSENRPTSFLIDSTVVSAEFAEWLRSNSTVASRLWFKTSEPCDRERVEEILATHEVPVQEINTIRRDDDGGGMSWRINELSYDAPSFNTRTQRDLRFGQARERIALSKDDATRSTYQIVLDERPAFEEFAAAIKEASSWTVSEQAISLRVSIKDGCRWASRGCPAGNGERWLIDEQGSVRPCHSASAVAQVGERLVAATEQIENLRVEEEARRGCERCEVRAVCSKCLFPAPFTAEEYCALRRADQRLTKFVDGLHLIRSLKDSEVSGEMTGAATIVDLVSAVGLSVAIGDREIPLSDCVLVAPERQSTTYLFNQGQEFLSQLPPSETEVIKSLLTDDLVESPSRLMI
jgi:radical SAM protein with 4Fe4S-binding SPASM domain